jgi:hypothetical protein
VYWFAPLRNGDVLRVRQRLCPDCVATNIEALLAPPDAETLTCGACGINVEDDLYAIYLTYYPPKAGPIRGAMALCEEHHLELRLRASMNSTVLEDRMLDAVDAVTMVPEPPTAVVRLGSAVDAARAHPSAEAVYRGLGRVDPGIKHGA